MHDLKKGILKSQKTIGEKGAHASSPWPHPQSPVPAVVFVAIIYDSTLKIFLKIFHLQK